MKPPRKVNKTPTTTIYVDRNSELIVFHLIKKSRINIHRVACGSLKTDGQNISYYDSSSEIFNFTQSSVIIRDYIQHQSLTEKVCFRLLKH